MKPSTYDLLLDLIRIGDKMSDAAQAMLDHDTPEEKEKDKQDGGYDAKMHRLELKGAVKEWLEVRRAKLPEGV